ncbi:right-handed parallel beta-helix repeat-containing protein [Neobacillus sp. MM2021_6]|uniref:right-handed parallel beta-helix repeat-containing protein n=1 Tax=Bacillaceae TaxID=186817 RepID=UPI001409ED88|nr:MULTISPECIES: right-handed parallel beta-helix repeat-containing protein [Bacillaceae]MBO0959566.1 right-handed parallel beta-helix repeat-containing protein [Neobacillus sp. MM2021_6]NHC17136.1 right-handed parallel beta-helix repeat-containing protein [Bacillus sp. MM2020_4]
MPVINADVRWKKGPKERLPVLEPGVPAYTTDTKEAFVGTPTGNIQLAKQEAIEQVNERFDEIAKVNVNVEVEAARGGEQTLGDRLNGFTTELAQITFDSGVAYVSKFYRDLQETDDNGRLQRAIDSLPNGGKVVLPNKTLSITGVVVPQGIILEGVSSESSKLYNTGISPAIKISGTVGDNLTHVILRDFAIEGNNINSGHGIDCSYATNLVILENLDVTYNDEGLHTENSWTIRATNCRFQWNRNDGVDLRNATNNVLFVGCYINFNYGNGFYSNGNDVVSLVDCDIEGNRKNGVLNVGGNAFNIVRGYYEQNGQLNDAINKYADIEIGTSAFPCKFASVGYAFINSKLAEYSLHVVGVTVMETRRNTILQAQNGTTTKGIYVEVGADRFISEYDHLGTGLSYTDLSNGDRITREFNNKYTKKTKGNIIHQLDRGDDTRILSQRLLSNGVIKGSLELDPNTNDMVFARWTGTAGSEVYKEYMRLKQQGLVAQFLGAIQPPTLSEVDAPNGTFFTHIGDGKLKFKDGNGVVNPLY